jgi:ubiquinone/menaquinone biosynthesis C-methylase UbiE/ribosomal protein L37AE/L43A
MKTVFILRLSLAVKLNDYQFDIADFWLFLPLSRKGTEGIILHNPLFGFAVKIKIQAIMSELICCPKCKKELRYSGQENASPELSGVWQCQYCGNKYSEYEGYINFAGEREVFRCSERERFARSIYARYYTPLTNLMFLPCGGVNKARKEVLENLEIRPGSTVLETGIGTGDNIPFLNCRLEGCLFYGLDNQQFMLRKCARNSDKWKLPVKLYRANAEELPFKDNSFDVVFHLGAINLFKDKKQAIDEMVRVARSGTRIVIADETEKASRLMAIFVGRHEPVVPPVGLVPETMQEIELKTIWNGYGYLITFRKP